MKKGNKIAVGVAIAGVVLIGAVGGKNIFDKVSINKEVSNLIAAQKKASSTKTYSYTEALNEQGIFLNDNGLKVFSNGDVDHALALIADYANSNSNGEKKAIADDLLSLQGNVSNAFYDAVCEQIANDIGTKSKVGYYYNEEATGNEPVITFKVYEDDLEGLPEQQLNIGDRVYKKGKEMARTLYYLNRLNEYSSQKDVVNAYKELFANGTEYFTLGEVAENTKGYVKQ